jgi:chemotaxis family two-component system response regulator Rcp1
MTMKRHILLVEDNPGDVFFAQEAFEESGLDYDLHIAKDGEKALQFIDKKPPYDDAPRPDLVLLDLNLPKIYGVQILEYLKSKPEYRSIPVIIMTSSCAQKDIQASYDLYANGYIPKPVNMDQYIRVIKTMDAYWFHTVLLPTL